MDERDFYIFGKPIKTEFGLVRFLTYEEYWRNATELNLISMNTLHIYYLYRKEFIKQRKDEKFLEEFKNFKKQSLYKIVTNTDWLLNSYFKIFRMVLDVNEYSDQEMADVIYSIMEYEESFMYFRKLIMDMNLLQEEEVSSNEEIQEWNEISKQTKQQINGEKTFVDIVTSIVASTKYDFEEVADKTVFQINSLYARLGAIHNHNATVLFAIVSPDVDIEPWDKHIDLFENKSTNSMKRSEFDRKYGNML